MVMAGMLLVCVCDVECVVMCLCVSPVVNCVMVCETCL